MTGRRPDLENHDRMSALNSSLVAGRVVQPEDILGVSEATTRNQGSKRLKARLQASRAQAYGP